MQHTHEEHEEPCAQCDESRLVERFGLCVPCYQAAKALGYSDAEIWALAPESAK